MGGRGTVGLVAGILALGGLAALFGRTEADRSALVELRAEHERLRAELGRATAALKDVVERLDAAAPGKQALQAANASLEIVVRSDREVDAHDLGCPSRVTFFKGQSPLLELSAADCFLQQKGAGHLAWKATVQMDPGHAGSGRPVSALAEADRLEAEIELIDPGSKVLGGKVVCTLNSAIRVEVPVPPQTTQRGRVTAPVSKEALARVQ